MLYFGECVVVDYILLYEMQMRKNMVIQDFILGQRSNLIRLTAVNRLYCLIHSHLDVFICNE